MNLHGKSNVGLKVDQVTNKKEVAKKNMKGKHKETTNHVEKLREHGIFTAMHVEMVSPNHS